MADIFRNANIIFQIPYRGAHRSSRNYPGIIPILIPSFFYIGKNLIDILGYALYLWIFFHIIRPMVRNHCSGSGRHAILSDYHSIASRNHTRPIISYGYVSRSISYKDITGIVSRDIPVITRYRHSGIRDPYPFDIDIRNRFFNRIIAEWIRNGTRDESEKKKREENVFHRKRIFIK